MPTRLVEPLAVDVEQTAAWGIGAVGADRSTRTGAGVVPCVLDTGIDASHPAFAGVSLLEEDFSGTGTGDRQGHGTHCAGTVFGRDVEAAEAVARRIDSGICHVNGATVHDEPQMPFGGVKHSGWGRFGGDAALDEFTELRWLTRQDGSRKYPI